MSGPISKLYAAEGQLWLRVNHGHSVSEHWLRDNAPDLYAEWWAAPSAAAQDQVALRIEQRLDDVEGPDVSTAAVNRMVERVAEAGSWELMARHRQSSAQERQASPQRTIRSSSLISSQLRAQRSQISAHAAQVWTCNSEWRNMKFALVWQISAQSANNRR